MPYLTACDETKALLRTKFCLFDGCVTVDEALPFILCCVFLNRTASSTGTSLVGFHSIFFIKLLSCMKKLNFIFAFLIVSAITACRNSPDVIHDLEGADYPLLNQDSTVVNFPSDFAGEYLVVGFIYTHCPDICPITTANMKNIRNKLKDTSNVHFVGISFDPMRDTPTVLKNYMKSFKLDENNFTMLTGDSTTVDSVLHALDIDAEISYVDTTAEGQRTYRMNHTDRISVMDTRGRVRFEYPGSRVPPEHVVEDLNKLRNSWYEF